MTTAKATSHWIWIGFIAAQIAVILPLLMVGEWAFHAVRNSSAYTHPADFETWEAIFNPVTGVRISLMENFFLWFQLIVAWFVSFIWHRVDAKSRYRKHLWTLTGALAWMALFVGPFLMTLSHGIAPAGTVFPAIFCTGVYLQSWLTLLYAHQRLRGVERPPARPIVLWSLLATVPVLINQFFITVPRHRSFSAQVQQVLQAGSPVDVRTKDGETMLHYAVAQGDDEVVTNLLHEGADPNARDKDGSTPLQTALDRGDSDIVILLKSMQP